VSRIASVIHVLVTCCEDFLVVRKQVVLLCSKHVSDQPYGAASRVLQMRLRRWYKHETQNMMFMLVNHHDYVICCEISHS